MTGRVDEKKDNTKDDPGAIWMDAGVVPLVGPFVLVCGDRTASQTAVPHLARAFISVCLPLSLENENARHS